MNWKQSALQSASAHPTIVAMRERAQWHRKESENFLVHSVHAMHQHDKDASHMEATATALEMEMVAKAGITAGEWIAYAVGRSKDVGRYIQVQTAQGWNPDYFWCEAPQTVKAESAALM